MNPIFNVTLNNDTLNLSFGNNFASESDILKVVALQCDELISNGCGGPILKVEGYYSATIIMIIGMKLKNLYSTIAIYDLSVKGFYVVHSIGGTYNIGDIIN